MNEDQKLVNTKTQQLLDGLKEQFPYVHTSLPVVEK